MHLIRSSVSQSVSQSWSITDISKNKFPLRDLIANLLVCLPLSVPYTNYKYQCFVDYLTDFYQTWYWIPPCVGIFELVMK